MTKASKFLLVALVGVLLVGGTAGTVSAEEEIIVPEPVVEAPVVETSGGNLSNGPQYFLRALGITISNEDAAVAWSNTELRDLIKSAWRMATFGY